jgi:hypothetical protein
MSLIANSRKQLPYARPPVRVRTTAVKTVRDFDACHADPAYFITSYVTIDDAQPGADTSAAAMPFHLWPAQVGLLADLRTERLILILKARQLGISWLVCGYALWLCLFRPGRLVLMFSIGQDEANELLRRVSVMYHRLPADMLAVLPRLERENKSAIAWANGSRIESLPATRTAGSGYTASLVILDEFSKNQWARELYTAVKPTIDGGGAMIVLSSAHGMGNLFHELCERAMEGVGRFAFRFLPWQARPGRDAQWYAQTAADAISASLMGQEYPAHPTEAFAASHAERFLPSMAWWDACKEDLPPLDAHTPIVIALDAGEVSDTFALVGTSRHPDPSRWHDAAVRLVRIWDPKDGPLEYDAIEREIIETILDRYNVVQVCYDRYQLRQMTQRLSSRVWCVEFSQSTDRLIADKHLYDLVQARHIAHDGNALLRSHIDNADRKVESQDRLRIVKRRDSLKIDASVACSMASYRMLTEFQ